jgi:DNA-binding response OmpR family regulator
MNVLSFIPRSDLQRRAEKALGSAQFVWDKAASAKECLELTRFGPYAGVLVDSDSLMFQDIVLLVKLLREENPGASIFVFARYLDLYLRLKLFEAGADDCVLEPFFTSELAVRLGLSIRLRQAATDPAPSQHGGSATFRRPGTGPHPAKSHPEGKNHRSAAQGISPVGISGKKRESSPLPYHDSGACLEHIL